MPRGVLVASDPDAESDRYTSGHSVRRAGHIQVGDAVHPNVLDARRIEPDVVVGAGFGRDAPDVVVVRVVFDGPRVEVDGLSAAVLPHPIWHRMAVAVAQRVDDGRDAGQVSPAGSEPVVPAPPLRRVHDHGFAQRREARPVLG